MKSTAGPALCAVLGIVTMPPAAAHHSGLYDDANIVAIEGRITRIDWINPHVRLEVAVEQVYELDEAIGEVDASPAADPTSAEREPWTVEGTSVNALERWGLTRDALVVGDAIRVVGPRSRFVDNAMLGAVARLGDAEESVFLWPNRASSLGLAETGVNGLFPPPARDGSDSSARGVYRVWTPRGRPPAIEPDALPLRAAARARLNDYDPLTDDPALRCEPPGMPVMLDTPYPVEFVEDEDRILIRYEEWDAERSIFMQPGAAPPVQDHSLRGTSFGRWDDGTLEIFTLYIDYPYLDDLGTPQSRDATVLERYTPNADFSRLDWDYTVTDPTMLTETVTRRGYYSWEPGEVIKPFDCTLAEE